MGPSAGDDEDQCDVEEDEEEGDGDGEQIEDSESDGQCDDGNDRASADEDLSQHEHARAAPDNANGGTSAAVDPTDDVIDVCSNSDVEAEPGARQIELPNPAGDASVELEPEMADVAPPPAPPPTDEMERGPRRAAGGRRTSRHPKSFDYGIFTIRYRDDSSVYYPDRIPSWIAFCPLHSSSSAECSKSIQINQPSEEVSLRRLLTWCLAANQFRTKSATWIAFQGCWFL